MTCLCLSGYDFEPRVKFDGGCHVLKVVISFFVFPCLFLSLSFVSQLFTSFPPSLSLWKEPWFLIIVLGKWCIGWSKVSALEVCWHTNSAVCYATSHLQWLLGHTEVMSLLLLLLLSIVIKTEKHWTIPNSRSDSPYCIVHFQDTKTCYYLGILVNRRNNDNMNVGGARKDERLWWV